MRKAPTIAYMNATPMSILFNTTATETSKVWYRPNRDLWHLQCDAALNRPNAYVHAVEDHQLSFACLNKEEPDGAESPGAKEQLD